MTRACPLLSLSLAAVLAGLPKSSLSDTEKLQHDPFERPALSGLQNASKPGPGRTGRSAAAQSTRKLKLQAVMVAGPKSMANVDGVMVRIGDEVHGYRLVEVHEGEAVFERNNTRFTISIRGNGQAPGASRETDATPVRSDAQAPSSPPEKDSAPLRSGTPEGAVERQ